MRLPPASIFWLAACLLAASCILAAEDPYQEGQRAYVAGDLVTAQAKFRAALQLNPNNQLARNYLAMITALEKKSGVAAGHDLETKLAGLILPKVELKDATLSAVLDFLSQQASALSGGKVTANFVLVAPPEAAQKRVTLSLTSVPFPEVLHYLADLTGMKFTIEKYAIRVTPAGTEKPAS